jgi:hypothetical protein
MDKKIYKVSKIEGEYAYLLDTENTDEEMLFIAMALLPMGTDIGTLLTYENFSFSII